MSASDKQKAMMALAEAARSLEMKHFFWIVKEAFQHFDNETKRLELEILQHERFRDDMILRIGDRAVSRDSRIEELLNERTQYRNILAFLRALKRFLDEVHGEQIAAEMAGFFTHLRGKKK